MIHLWIPSLPKLPNTLLGAHWRVRSSHAKKWKRLVGDAYFAAYPNGQLVPSGMYPLKKARITFIRYSPRSCDADNLCSSFKAVLDALVHHGMIEDDSPKHVECSYLWVKTPRKEQGVRICVESMME